MEDLHTSQTVDLNRKDLDSLLATNRGFRLVSSKQPKKVVDEVERAERLKNDDLEQDIKLKRLTLKILLYFLGGETIIIFIFAWFQATGWLTFSLEEWSFRIIISATITQIYLMLRIAVEYLFPKK